MSRRKCSVPSCELQCPFHNLFCWHHWSLLPRNLQRQITLAWHPGKLNYRWNADVRKKIKLAVAYLELGEML